MSLQDYEKKADEIIVSLQSHPAMTPGRGRIMLAAFLYEADRARQKAVDELEIQKEITRRYIAILAEQRMEKKEA